MSKPKKQSGYLRKALQQHIKSLKEEVKRCKRNLWDTQKPQDEILEDEIFKLKEILNATFDNPSDDKHTCKSGGAPCKECLKERRQVQSWFS